MCCAHDRFFASASLVPPGWNRNAADSGWVPPRRSPSRHRPDSRSRTGCRPRTWTFSANAAWLALHVLAHNLLRGVATLARTGLERATSATLRRPLLAVPGRLVHSARAGVYAFRGSWASWCATAKTR